MIAFTFVVTALALLALAVPLGLDVRSRIRNDERSELAKLAAIAAADIGASSSLGSDPIELATPSDSTTQLGVYAPDGRREAGTGPERLDPDLTDLTPGRVREITADGKLIVAVPIASDERLTAIVRAAEPQSVLRRATRAAWIRIAFAALAALLLATAFASLVANRLLRPLHVLHERAKRLGSGDVDGPWADSGLIEIDTIATALQESAYRIDASMTRERAFSADVSHQLRTPVTGLKLTLETEIEHPRTNATIALTEALHSVDVLETKIETMLSLARDTMTQLPSVNVVELIESRMNTFTRRAHRVGRNIALAAAPELPEIRTSARAIGEVLDVLIDNALVHAQGSIVIGIETRTIGAAITVTDQGPGIADSVALFDHRTVQQTTRRSGVGLPLARRLAEAEGAQLLLTHSDGHCCFELILPAVPR